MVDKEYDSAEDTNAHRHLVHAFMMDLIGDLSVRARKHDESKLFPPEKAIFDVVTPKLKGLTYGSDEYKESLGEMQEALKHHYANNRHHPEYFATGVEGMTLVDLIEMICDWKSATMRHEDGNIYRSLELNKTRFNMSQQLYQILMNTVVEYFEE